MDKRGACTHTLGNARARRSSDARDEPLLSPRKANFALTFPDLWRFPKYLVKSVYHGQEFQPASAYEKVVHGLPSLSSPSPGRRPGYPWCAARRSLPQENLVSRKSFPPQQTDARGAWNVVNHGQDSDRVSSPLPPLRYSARFSNRPRFIKSWYTLSSRWVGSVFEIESCANVWRTLALLLQKRERRREGCIAIREKIGLTWWKYVFFSFLFVLFVCYLEVQIYLNYLFNFDTGLIVDRIFLGNFSRFRFLKLCMNIYVG